MAEPAQRAQRSAERRLRHRPVVLAILDGLGLRPEREGNAVALASTPTLDRLRATCPSATLRTCGTDVGLPDGQMGNSEVGHMNLGAGRIVWMDLPKINREIETGALLGRDAVQAHIAALRASGGACHLCGLLSDGGVHGHLDHIVCLARGIAAAGVQVRLHLFTDGRDVAPDSAPRFIAALRAALGDEGGVQIATVSGRYYAMDRDNRWDRVEKAYRAIADADGVRAHSPEAAVKAAYDFGKTDEFVAPAVIADYAGMRDGDGLFFTNFRTDRARELLCALADSAFDAFARRPVRFAHCLGMVEYSERHNGFMEAVFPAEDIADTLGAVVSAAGLTQFRLAETEKYPHVTFFLNGGVETPYPGESRHMAPSPKVATYDLQPEMSEAEVTRELVGAIRSGAQDLIVVNYANPDMVGHTGVLEAAIRAVEAVDAGLSQAVDAVREVGGAMLVLADHGNCETMIDPETGGPHTAHTLNEVPVYLVGADLPLRQGGRLADVAPTLLRLLGLPQPETMTGEPLIDERAQAVVRA